MTAGDLGREHRFRSADRWHRRGWFRADEIRAVTGSAVLNTSDLPTRSAMPSAISACARALRRHGARGVQREWAGEDREATQQLTLRLAQQLIAPVECRTQRPMPGQRGTAATCQQRETIVQSARDLLDAQCRRPGGGELDGERYAVKMAANRRDHGRISRIRREVRAELPGSGDEQLHRAVAQNARSRRSAPIAGTSSGGTR